MNKCYDEYHDDNVGTLLCEARDNDRDRAIESETLQNELMLISLYCKLLQSDSPPVTHIRVLNKDISIAEINRLIDKYCELHESNKLCFPQYSF